MEYIEIILGVVATVMAGVIGYVVTFVNKMNEKLIEAEKEIIKIKCNIEHLNK